MLSQLNIAAGQPPASGAAAAVNDLGRRAAGVLRLSGEKVPARLIGRVLQNGLRKQKDAGLKHRDQGSQKRRRNKRKLDSGRRLAARARTEKRAVRRRRINPVRLCITLPASFAQSGFAGMRCDPTLLI